MAEFDFHTFCKHCARDVLKNKKVLMLGDSNLRAIYKDMIWLCKNDCLISKSNLRRKFEPSYLGDRLLTKGTLHAGRHYEEVRSYLDFEFHVEFRFTTRCFDDDFKNVMWSIKHGYGFVPDVVVVGSCVWDLTRWGPNGVDDYMRNVPRAMKTLRWCVPPETAVVWLTASPPSFETRGGFLVRRLDFLRPFLRWHVTEANRFVYESAVRFRQDVIDLHFYLQMQLHRRAEDGIHWEPDVVRFSTNLLLEYVSKVSNDRPTCLHARSLRKRRGPNEDPTRKRKNGDVVGDVESKRSKISE